MVASFPGLPSYLLFDLYNTWIRKGKSGEKHSCTSMYYTERKLKNKNGWGLGTRVLRSVIVIVKYISRQAHVNHGKVCWRFLWCPTSPLAMFALAGREHSKRYARRGRREMETITLINESISVLHLLRFLACHWQQTYRHLLMIQSVRLYTPIQHDCIILKHIPPIVVYSWTICFSLKNWLDTTWPRKQPKRPSAKLVRKCTKTISQIKIVGSYYLYE